MPFYGDMDDPVQRAKARHRIYWAQLIAYVLIIGVVVAGFYTESQDNKERCKAGEELRSVIRQQTLSFYEFVIAATRPQPGDPPRTPEQQARMEEFIEQTENQRDEQLSQIKPSKACQ